MRPIDLNADLGESYGRWEMGHDRDLLSLISSASVACGYHAGDPQTMLATVSEAKKQNVAVGAHPGYPDLLGFGRRDIGASPGEVRGYVIYQVGALAACCTAAGTRLRYVKPHGALYNKAARDATTADAIAEAIASVDPALVLLGLAGSELIAAGARAGLRTAAEAFIDRAYEADGTLTPRGQPGAVLDDPEECADRAARMVLDGLVQCRDGTILELAPDSLCAHGDGPTAVAVLKATRARLLGSGVTIAPFAP